MRTRFTRPLSLMGCLLALVALTFSGPARAEDTVAPGWSLFQTLTPPTSLAGVPLVGVPFGTFDFGGSIGTQYVGPTDTIWRRNSAATAPSATIPVELVAAQLMSAIPVDIGAGLDFHFVTLQSARGGPASVGTQTINFGPEGTPHGTFDSFFDVFFDIRLGSLNGPIILSADLPLISIGVPWSHTDPNALVIPGVNYKLKGNGTTDQDFFPVGPIVEQGAGIAVHGLITTHVPEPGSVLMFLAGSVALAGVTLRRRRS